LEAIISSAEIESLLGEAELKRQELSDAKLLVDDATEQLKSEGFKFIHHISYFEV
jgi:structural maintenance of chromosome 3 (chondroitin sulfate proteoglycan 6)